MDAMESKIQQLLQLLESVAQSHTRCHFGAHNTDGFPASAPTVVPVSNLPPGQGFGDMTTQVPEAEDRNIAELQSDE